MPTIIPIQEVAYTLPVASISTINHLYVQLVWNEFYGFNPDDLSYKSNIVKTVTIPVASISCAVEENKDENGNETACSIVIKSGNATVLSLNNNNYNIDTSAIFTITDFNTINDSIYSASIA